MYTDLTIRDLSGNKLVDMSSWMMLN